MTDKNHAEQIQEIISEVTKMSTYSADAMQQFVDLQKAVDEQESTIKFLRKQRDEKAQEAEDAKGQIKTLEGDKATLMVQLNGWIEREQELLKREAECLEWQLRCEYNETRVADHKEMVGQIFRNTVLKKEVFTALPGLRADDSYGNRTEPYAQPGTVSETEE